MVRTLENNYFLVQTKLGYLRYSTSRQRMSTKFSSVISVLYSRVILVFHSIPKNKYTLAIHFLKNARVHSLE